MSFGNILTSLGRGFRDAAPALVPVVVSAINPALGPVTSMVLNAVIQAETTIGPGNGQVKLQQVMGTLEQSVPSIISYIEMVTGSRLADEAKLREGMQYLAEGIVRITNAFRILPKATTVVSQ